MTDLPTLTLSETSLEQIAEIEGRIVIFMPESGKLDQSARRVNRLMRGALERFAESTAFSKMKQGEATDLAFPTGMRADAVQVIRLDLTADPEAERRAGAAIGAGAVKGEVLIFAGERKKLEHLMMGCLLKTYAFGDHKTDHGERGTVEITMMVAKPDDLQSDLLRVRAVAEGVYFTRDLVNEPANVLTTVTFADRLEALRELGLKVEVLDEDRLEELGMRTLLAVGFGSETPSKVVIMEWTGSGTEAPLALVGKGVVFDTGGISIKPAGGMEEMTMDMGGAGTVAGVMKALALRKAAANVVGIVGLVENMPDGRAQRPGDVVRSMKGDTVEVINTDAEGRLVLCDIMWYAQERFEPRAMIDLATLTGAVIVALGHENAGVFSNDDTLVGSFLAAAATEDEGAWRMPLGEGYARALKSRIADVKNTGGRPAGSITAAEFLQRFVKKDTPWIHLDIAGVASTDEATTLSPKGATGWGVRALDRLVSDRFEG